MRTAQDSEAEAGMNEPEVVVWKRPGVSFGLDTMMEEVGRIIQREILFRGKWEGLHPHTLGLG